jgi:hypothetical protein
VPVYDRLETFANEAEFSVYVDQLRRIHQRYQVRRDFTGGARPILLAGEVECPEDEECEELSEVQVTGSRVTTPQSITNNQVSGVDEGDIVKSWGRFLVVLQDARLFSIDLGEAPGQMRLADRVNAYEDAEADAWYDELLIHDNHVLVTGYSYEAEQTEISVFDLDGRGRLTLKSRFFVKSEDYFSGGNYASRLVNGELVIYTPIDLEALGSSRQVKLPMIRSWTPKGGYTRWQTLLSPTDIYRPMDRTLSPVIHAVSACPALSRASSRCKSVGVVSAHNRELYVTPEAAYLWTVSETVGDRLWYSNRCEQADAGPITPRPAMLYQLPFNDDAVKAVRVHGDPPDQFSMERRGSRFHALVRRIDSDCSYGRQWPLDLFSFPMWQFSDLPAPVASSRVHAMPAAGEGYLSARFSEDYLTYGAGKGWRRLLWREDEPTGDSRLFVTVPLKEPGRARVHALDHSIERVELLGRNVITFGVSADRSLGATAIDLRGKPVPAGTIRLPGVLESEGRSHAFNARVEEDGSALFGLPTAIRIERKDEDGEDYRDLLEHVHYFNADPALQLSLAGAIPGEQLPDNEAYECEMSCYDWYGNARPIFYRGRIFALLAEEFAEARVEGGALKEIRRMDLTLPPAH